MNCRNRSWCRLRKATTLVWIELKVKGLIISLFLSFIQRLYCCTIKIEWSKFPCRFFIGDSTSTDGQPKKRPLEVSPISFRPWGDGRQYDLQSSHKKETRHLPSGTLGEEIFEIWSFRVLPKQSANDGKDLDFLMLSYSKRIGEMSSSFSDNDCFMEHGVSTNSERRWNRSGSMLVLHSMARMQHDHLTMRDTFHRIRVVGVRSQSLDSRCYAIEVWSRDTEHPFLIAMTQEEYTGDEVMLDVHSLWEVSSSWSEFYKIIHSTCRCLEGSDLELSRGI